VLLVLVLLMCFSDCWEVAVDLIYTVDGGVLVGVPLLIAEARSILPAYSENASSTQLFSQGS